MTILIKRLSGFAIAVMALALSASLAFAGQPAASRSGLSKAVSHAERTVPVAAEADAEGADEDTDADAGTDESTETDEATEPDETTETDETDSESADNCLTDPTLLTEEELAAMSHGSIVCWAAQQTTWDTTLYRNHGAFVSHWAKTGKGGADASTKQHGKSHSH